MPSDSDDYGPEIVLFVPDPDRVAFDHRFPPGNPGAPQATDKRPPLVARIDDGDFFEDYTDQDYERWAKLHHCTNCAIPHSDDFNISQAEDAEWTTDYRRYRIAFNRKQYCSRCYNEYCNETVTKDKVRMGWGLTEKWMKGVPCVRRRRPQTSHPERSPYRIYAVGDLEKVAFAKRAEEEAEAAAKAAKQLEKEERARKRLERQKDGLQKKDKKRSIFDFEVDSDSSEDSLFETPSKKRRRVGVAIMNDEKLKTRRRTNTNRPASATAAPSIPTRRSARAVAKVASYKDPSSEVEEDEDEETNLTLYPIVPPSLRRNDETGAQSRYQTNIKQESEPMPVRQGVAGGVASGLVAPDGRRVKIEPFGDGQA